MNDVAKTTASGPYRTLSERLAAEAAAGGYQPGTWAPITLPAYLTDTSAVSQNGNDPAGVRLDSNGVVYLRGALFLDVAAAITAGALSDPNSSSIAPGTVTLFTLPEVFWPEQARIVAQIAILIDNNATLIPIFFTVYPNGEVLSTFGSKVEGQPFEDSVGAASVAITFVGDYHPE